MTFHKKVTVSKKSEQKTIVYTNDIPVGFFSGTIGTHSGLFFRSPFDIVCLHDAGSWGYKYAPGTYYINSSNGCEVSNYEPVEVTITY